MKPPRAFHKVKGYCLFYKVRLMSHHLQPWQQQQQRGCGGVNTAAEIAFFGKMIESVEQNKHQSLWLQIS